MTGRLVRTGATAAVVCGLLVGGAVPAHAKPAPPAPAPVSVVASGLIGPLQVEMAPNGSLFVAEAFAGQVTEISKQGRRKVVARGFGDFAPGIGMHGGQLFITSSTDPHAGSPYGGAELLRLSQGGAVTQRVDLLAHELRDNPDKQDPDAGDAVSNPYDVLALPGRVLVADAGGNSIIEVRANGKVRTFTALPVSPNPACPPNNTVPPEDSCDPVPTGIALGPDGYIYVSGLGGEVEGHVWKLHPTTGRIVQTWSGLPPLTGIAAAPNGTLYVSAFTSEAVQEVLRLAPGTRAVTGSVKIPSATGLTFANGALYVTSGFTGNLYRVQPTAF